MDKRKFILGTDWWTDCDDVVALRILLNAVKNGQVDLLGIAVNACMPYSVASVKGFVKAEGLDPNSFPVGLDFEATDFGGNPPYQKRLADNFYFGGDNSEAENAVKLYRRLLVAQDEPVEIIEIGYLQVMASVLGSLGDEISPLSGIELIKKKVKKFWVMGGRWDVDLGRENNFCRNDRARRAAEKFCRECPVPVTFLGYEVGESVVSGGGLKWRDPLRKVLKDHHSVKGRASWDPMLVQLALTGDETKAGYRCVKGKATVDAISGANHFEKNADGLHTFVIKDKDDGYYKNQIENIIKK